jgi:myo-inositol 2-dehydrogenase/D-chiro-inositol 1-dehydrogenase
MHAKNLAAHPRVELAGIYDVDSAASAAVARETGTQPSRSLGALLGDRSVDAVLIASSTDTHCTLIEHAVRARKAVLCEKPIHLDINRVDACGQVVKASGMPVQIGFNRRFDPSHSALRDAVVEGEIGRIEQAVITSRDPAPPPLDYLRVSGGIFRDMAIHDFDMARFLFGEEPVEITAMGGVMVDQRIGAIGDLDTVMAVLRMESGALCHINGSRRCVYGYDQRIELFGEDGMLVSENPRATHLVRHTSRATSVRDRLHYFFIERYAESYIREIDAFVDAVEAGVMPSPSFDDGRRALLAANAAVESAASGRAVRVAA